MLRNQLWKQMDERNWLKILFQWSGRMIEFKLILKSVEENV